jgi:hypothetical protein
MIKAIETLDLPSWVARASGSKRHFREAVHIILGAVGTSVVLRTQMIMKVGMLMAIKYDSTRFTKDADFSTRDKYTKGDETALLAELDTQLTLVNEQFPYDMMCRLLRKILKIWRPHPLEPTWQNSENPMI